MRKQELIKKVIGGETFKFQGFAKGVFSNWYPVRFKIDGIEYFSSEQAFMAMKAEFFGDFIIKEKIINTHSPATAKDYGRKVSNFDEEEWKAVREEKMYQAIRSKFMQNEPIKNTLLKTENDILVEANSADLIWGAGIDISDHRVTEPMEWPGENLLGFILMDFRDNLRGK
jgi:ribA/ribD-fused uncharacterized protein